MKKKYRVTKKISKGITVYSDDYRIEICYKDKFYKTDRIRHIGLPVEEIIPF